MAQAKKAHDSDLDLETIYHAEGSPTAEVEALAIKALLESNGIAAVVVGDSIFPNLPFEVKVPRKHAERARQLIAEAEKKAKPRLKRKRTRSEIATHS
jgi:hypothetical protein